MAEFEDKTETSSLSLVDDGLRRPVDDMSMSPLGSSSLLSLEFRRASAGLPPKSVSVMAEFEDKTETSSLSLVDDGLRRPVDDMSMSTLGSRRSSLLLSLGSCSDILYWIFG
jgi:hypothetical protein